MSALHDEWPALSGLLDDTLALPPGERDAWPAGLPGINAQHRETLRALLGTQAEIETGDFLADLPPLPPQTSPHSGAAPGALVGPYRGRRGAAALGYRPGR